MVKLKNHLEKNLYLSLRKTELGWACICSKYIISIICNKNLTYLWSLCTSAHVLPPSVDCDLMQVIHNHTVLVCITDTKTLPICTQALTKQVFLTEFLDFDVWQWTIKTQHYNKNLILVFVEENWPPVKTVWPPCLWSLWTSPPVHSSL